MELLRIFREFIARKNGSTVKRTYAGITNREFVSVSGGSIEEWEQASNTAKPKVGGRSTAAVGFI